MTVKSQREEVVLKRDVEKSIGLVEDDNPLLRATEGAKEEGVVEGKGLDINEITPLGARLSIVDLGFA